MLLACRQCNLLRLARSLPSRGAGAWRCVPLLPWRVQCPGHVCAALTAGQGGWDRCRLLLGPPSCFPLLPRTLRYLLRVVSSGCPLPLPGGTPFHAAFAFCGLGPVALRVRAACRLPVCALALLRRTPPPPPPTSVWHAHRAQFLCRAPVGPFQAVRTPPRLLPRSRALLVYFWGDWPGPFVHLPCSGSVAPLSVGLCVRGGLASEAAWGGGGRPACRLPSGGGRAPVGRGASEVGSGVLLVRPCASLARAPRLALSASLPPWRMRSPYCSGSCPCASAGNWRAGKAGTGAPPPLWGGGVTGLLVCVPPLGRLRGERGRDGQGTRGAWTWRRAWRGGRPRAPRRCGAPRRRLSRGGGGGGLSPGLPVGFCAGVARWRWALRPRVPGGVAGCRHAAE